MTVSLLTEVSSFSFSIFGMKKLSTPSLDPVASSVTKLSTTKTQSQTICTAQEIQLLTAFLTQICNHKYSCTTIHRYPIFSTRYTVMCKVYTGYCGTSEVSSGIISPYMHTNHALSPTNHIRLIHSKKL